MSGGPKDTVEGVRRIRWSAVALGWLVAAFAGGVTSTLLKLLYRLFVEPLGGRGELTVTLVVISVVSGFLSYLAGGYAAARVARHSGGRHGALTAVCGLVVGLSLATIFRFFGGVFAEGVAIPPAGFGLTGAALASGSILFLTNLFGGFVGGKIGEPPEPIYSNTYRSR